MKKFMIGSNIGTSVVKHHHTISLLKSLTKHQNWIQYMLVTDAFINFEKINH